MQPPLAPPVSNEPFDPLRIERPDPSLWKYYVFTSLLVGPFFPLVLLPLYFKYETLKYQFREDGVSMSWGILFRHEVHLTYRRIQDIHLTRNVVQRWLGLATLSVQTASGSAMPELSIEGIPQAEQLRDFLYARMRGATADSVVTATSVSGDPVSATGTSGSLEPVGASSGGGPGATTPSSGESLELLREIRDLLHQVAARKSGGAP